MELAAVSGDFPVRLLKRLPGQPAYKDSVVKKLKRAGLLRTYYRDGLRTLRLDWPAKELLVQENPERFSFFLTGTAETNRLKSEKTRRLRLARSMAATRVPARCRMACSAKKLSCRSSSPRASVLPAR